MLKTGTQNDDKFNIGSGGDSVSAGNGQDYVTYDATGWKGGAICQTLDGGAGTDTLLIRLSQAQMDKLKLELVDYAASLPKELNLLDRNFISASNPLGLNYSQFNKLLAGTLTTGQNNQANFFTFQSIGISIKQFEALRFEVVKTIPVNTAPDAKDDVFSATEDTETRIKVSDILANDTDADGDACTITSVQGAEHGTVKLVTIEGVQYVCFMPVTDYNGPAKFTYTISDGKGGTDTATVTLNIAAVNDAPVSGGGTAVAGNEDHVIVGTVPGATDVDGDKLTYQIASGVVDADGRAAGGTLDFHADGSFAYTPPKDYHGVVSFTYVASDGHVNSAAATVQITVNSVNDAPGVAETIKTLVIDEDSATGPIAIGASDVDGDTLSYAIKQGFGPDKGAVAFDQAQGTFTYTPGANLNGDDHFTILISDGHGGTTEQVVNVGITSVNDAPVPTSTRDTAYLQEMWDGHPDENVGKDEGQGLFVWKDADIGDHHTVSVTPLGDNYLSNVESRVYALSEGYTQVILDVSALDKSLDFLSEGETVTESYNVDIRDDAGAGYSRTFGVVIRGANDAPENLTDSNGAKDTVAEGAAKGTLVGITAKATDVDHLDTLTYYFKNGFGDHSQVSADGRFAIDAQSGVVTVQDGSKIDYETAPNHSYGMTVWAADNHGAETSTDFTVDVTDAVPTLHSFGSADIVAGHTWQSVFFKTVYSSPAGADESFATLFGPVEERSNYEVRVGNGEPITAANLKLDIAEISSLGPYGQQVPGPHETLDVYAYGGDGTITTDDYDAGSLIGSGTVTYADVQGPYLSIALDTAAINSILGSYEWLGIGVRLPAKILEVSEYHVVGFMNAGTSLDLVW